MSAPRTEDGIVLPGRVGEIVGGGCPRCNRLHNNDEPLICIAWLLRDLRDGAPPNLWHVHADGTTHYVGTADDCRGAKP